MKPTFRAFTVLGVLLLALRLQAYDAQQFSEQFNVHCLAYDEGLGWLAAGGNYDHTNQVTTGVIYQKAKAGDQWQEVTRYDGEFFLDATAHQGRWYVGGFGAHQLGSDGNLKRIAKHGFGLYSTGDELLIGKYGNIHFFESALPDARYGRRVVHAPTFQATHQTGQAFWEETMRKQ